MRETAITRDFARRQIDRILSRLYEPTKSEITDLINALASTAENEQHATEIIDTWVYDTTVDERGRRPAPSPGDILRVGHASRKTESRPAPECQQCSGSGWRIVERNGISGASKCDCWTAAPKREQLPLPVPSVRRGGGMTAAKEIIDTRALAAGDRK